MQVQSLTSLSGSGAALSSGVGRRCSLDLVFLWLRYRLVAVGLIQPLAWVLPYATGAALKSKREKEKKKEKKEGRGREGGRRRKERIEGRKEEPCNRSIPLYFLLSFLFFFFSIVLGRHLRHMEVPRLGVESELQLLPYTTATATPDPSCLCDLHCSSRQCRILNPWSEARDRTCNLMVPSQIRFHCATVGTPQ